MKIKSRFVMALVVSVVGLHFCACSSEFVGNSAKFGGGSGKKSSGAPQEISQDDGNEGDDSTGDDSQGEDATGDNIVIEGNSQCIDRYPGFGAVLDFESAPRGFVGSTHANTVIGSEFKKDYGVTFSSSTDHDAIVRKTTRVGETQPPSGEEAWLCILCPQSPSRNRLLDANAEASVGRFVLSSTAAASNSGGILRVDYTIPVASLSFDLIDVDGSEVWIIESFDGQNNVIPELTKSIRQDGYATDRTGNGTPTRIEISTPTGHADIKAFVIRGEKPSSKFGFAFDNFDPGIPTCTN